MHKQRMRFGPALDQCGNVFAEGRSHLESVSRTSAQEPHVVQFGVPVNQIVAVARRLVLADARLHQGSLREARESFSKKRAGSCQSSGARLSVHVGGFHFVAGRIVSHLEAAALIPRDAVEDSVPEVEPDRQSSRLIPRIARGNAEEKDLLPCGDDAPTHRAWKNLTQPRPARKDEPVGLDRGSVREDDVFHLSADYDPGPSPGDLVVTTLA